MEHSFVFQCALHNIVRMNFDRKFLVVFFSGIGRGMIYGISEFWEEVVNGMVGRLKMDSFALRHFISRQTGLFGVVELVSSISLATCGY